MCLPRRSLSLSLYPSLSLSFCLSHPARRRNLQLTTYTLTLADPRATCVFLSLISFAPLPISVKSTYLEANFRYEVKVFKNNVGFDAHGEEPLSGLVGAVVDLGEMQPHQVVAIVDWKNVLDPIVGLLQRVGKGVAAR